jgi:hypothetical protein
MLSDSYGSANVAFPPWIVAVVVVVVVIVVVMVMRRDKGD